MVYGTRPEALKLAPIVKACKARGLDIEATCTNQSPDLLGGLKLDCPHGKNTSPALVVVQGDTETAFEGAVAWFKEGVPLFHVEAGVRSGRLDSPFPEEGLRRMISQIATYHACTTEHNKRNLIMERVVGRIERQPDGKWSVSAELRTENIRMTGSPVVESVRERAQTGVGVPVDGIYLTLHRRENRGRFRAIVEAIGQVFDPATVRWLSHPNGWAASEAAGLPIQPEPPMQAAHFAGCLSLARLVITDSGGVVEEAQSLGTPSIQARTVTDRLECLGKGSFCWDLTTAESLLEHVQRIAESDAVNLQWVDRTIYGDGKASERIADWLAEIVA